MSSTVQVTDNTPLIFKAHAWEKYYRTQFPDSPDERPEFNSMSYDKSSAEFKALFSKLHKHTETSGFSVSFLSARSF